MIPQTTRRRRALPWLIAGVAIVAGGIGAAAALLLTQGTSSPTAGVGPSSSSIPADTFTMKSTVSLFVMSTSLSDGAPCWGSDNFADVVKGASVKIFDKQGKVLATAALPQGRFQSILDGGSCNFDLAIDGVPDGLPTYGVEVSGHGVLLVSSEAAHTGALVHLLR
jgi:hypothetical protein